MNEMIIRQNLALAIAIVSFFITITIALSTTGYTMYQFSIFIRQITAIATAVFGVLAIFYFKNYRSAFYGLSAFMMLYVYGIFVGTVFGGFEMAKENLFLTIPLCSLGLLLVGQKAPILPFGRSQFLLTYIFIILFLTIATGGLVLDFPPYFVYSYQEGIFGSNIEYSQGASYFFALGMIFSFILYQSARKRFSSLLFLTITLVFFLLCLIGGARGESLAAFVLLVYIGLVRKSTHSRLPLVLFIVMFFIWLLAFVDRDSIVLLGRLQILLEFSVGARDELYTDAVHILESNMQCFLFGCGFDYFQHYFNYDQGLYVHNFILESAIIWGVPLTLITTSFFLFGLYNAVRKEAFSDAFPYMALFAFLVSMKSGTLTSNWLFIVSFFHYFALGLRQAIKRGD